MKNARTQTGPHQDHEYSQEEVAQAPRLAHEQEDQVGDSAPSRRQGRLAAYLDLASQKTEIP
jgi:hypothetical protein